MMQENYQPDKLSILTVNSKLLINSPFLPSQMASQARHDDHPKFVSIPEKTGVLIGIIRSCEARSKAICEPNNHTDEIIKRVLNGQYLHSYNNLSYQAQIAALRL